MNQAVRRKKISIIAAVIIGVAAIVGLDGYFGRTWIASTYPADGAAGVPREITITAQWKGSRSNNLGITVRLADETASSVLPGVSFRTGDVFFKFFFSNAWAL